MVVEWYGMSKKIIKSLRIYNDQTLRPKDKVIILLIGLRLQTACQPFMLPTKINTQPACFLLHDALSFKFLLFDYFITFFTALTALS